MSRRDELRAALPRCEDRPRYAEQSLIRFAKESPHLVGAGYRRYRKLRADYELATNDVEVLRNMLQREFSRAVE